MIGPEWWAISLDNVKQDPIVLPEASSTNLCFLAVRILQPAVWIWYFTPMIVIHLAQVKQWWQLLNDEIAEFGPNQTWQN